jgi:hypothetical protein
MGAAAAKARSYGETFAQYDAPSPMGEGAGGNVYAQPGNLKETICVLQLKLPVEAIYSVVNQKVQSSTGSITSE